MLPTFRIELSLLLTTHYSLPITYSVIVLIEHALVCKYTMGEYLHLSYDQCDVTYIHRVILGGL